MYRHTLVAGLYQPMADGDALHITRTRRSSAVGARRHSQAVPETLAGALWRAHPIDGAGPLWSQPTDR